MKMTHLSIRCRCTHRLRSDCRRYGGTVMRKNQTWNERFVANKRVHIIPLVKFINRGNTSFLFLLLLVHFFRTLSSRHTPQIMPTTSHSIFVNVVVVLFLIAWIYFDHVFSRASCWYCLPLFRWQKICQRHCASGRSGTLSFYFRFVVYWFDYNFQSWNAKGNVDEPRKRHRKRNDGEQPQLQRQRAIANERNEKGFEW